MVENRIEYDPGDALIFRDPSIARTKGAPVWLKNAIVSGKVSIDLRVTPDSSSQDGPARIFALSQDYLSHNLVIGQDQSDLVVRLRRPGSQSDGQPAFVVGKVFEAGITRDVLVRIEPTNLHVEIDGRPVIDSTLPEGALKSWDDGYRLALGNEVVGLRPWNGKIERAVVRTPAYSDDLLAAGRLQKPKQWWQIPGRLRVPFAFSFPEDVLPTLLHLFAFTPIGIAASRSPHARKSYPLIMVLILILAVGIEASKVLIAGRHPTVINMIANFSGGLLGAIALPYVLSWRAKS